MPKMVQRIVPNLVVARRQVTRASPKTHIGQLASRAAKKVNMTVLTKLNGIVKSLMVQVEGRWGSVLDGAQTSAVQALRPLLQLCHLGTLAWVH